jgi:hypothetical protein
VRAWAKTAFLPLLAYTRFNPLAKSANAMDGEFEAMSQHGLQMAGLEPGEWAINPLPQVGAADLL